MKCSRVVMRAKCVSPKANVITLVLCFNASLLKYQYKTLINMQCIRVPLTQMQQTVLPVDQISFHSLNKTWLQQVRHTNKSKLNTLFVESGIISTVVDENVNLKSI